jgi:hypothetical protein
MVSDLPGAIEAILLGPRAPGFDFGTRRLKKAKALPEGVIGLPTRYFGRCEV